MVTGYGVSLSCFHHYDYAYYITISAIVYHNLDVLAR